MLDKLNAAKIQVIFGVGVKDCLAVYTTGRDVGVSNQLGTAPDEGQELIIIQPPDSMRACWFQPAN